MTVPDEPTERPAVTTSAELSEPSEPSELSEPSEPSEPSELSEPNEPLVEAAPDERELERIAEPATVRRAPKFRAFIGAGACVGAVLGLVLALATSSNGAASVGFLPFLGGDGSVRLLSSISLAVLGSVVGGALAVMADRRSDRRA